MTRQSKDAKFHTSVFPACLHFLTALIHTPLLVLCTTSRRSHLSHLFAIPDSLPSTVTRRSRGQWAVPVGWLPRHYVWAHTRQLLSMNGSHAHNLPPLCRNYCSEISQEFQIFERSACHRWWKLANGFKTRLRVGGRAGRQIAWLHRLQETEKKMEIKTISSSSLSWFPKSVCVLPMWVLLTF